MHPDPLSCVANAAASQWELNDYSPVIEIAPILCLPPVDLCSGCNPIGDSFAVLFLEGRYVMAANSCPARKPWRAGTSAVMAVVAFGPDYISGRKPGYIIEKRKVAELRSMMAGACGPPWRVRPVADP